MAITDAAAFIGSFPFRPGAETTPDGLLRHMDRLRIDRAWVGSLPSILHQDPAPANGRLYDATRPHRDRLLPVPTVNPEQARWQDDINRALEAGAPAMRVYPGYQGIAETGPQMRVAIVTAAAAGLPVILTVRFEDVRQRHPIDVVPEPTAAGVRTLVRLDTQVRLLVSHADRAFIEETHFGLTAAEQERLLWDLAWVWGPPEDHVAHLVRSLGAQRFAFGTGLPLRLGEAAFARLELAGVASEVRRQILEHNLDDWRVRTPRADGGKPVR
jgi:predicted TIM-barrel fold metal-dependent hydrolase